MSKSNKTQAILSGKAYPVLITFALPIICGNIFQQLYNVVDAIVVGRYIGDLPLAGVSAASPIMDVLYGIIVGGTVGVGTLLSQLNGAGNHTRLRKVHETMLLGGSLFILALSVISLLSARWILQVQDTKPAVIEESMKYLTLIFLGLILNYLYNYFASALRSCGDSRTPFIVLLASSVLHAGLDLLFGWVFRWGIRGVAVSTVSCQLLSAVFLFVYIQKKFPLLAVGRKPRIERSEIRPIAAFAFAGALQQIVVQLGRLLIQGMLSEMPLTGLNFTGENAKTNMVTGYNMGMRVENFLISITSGISAAGSVCIAQNFGNRNIPRVRRFFLLTMMTSLIYACFIFALCSLFPVQLIGIFSRNAQVLEAGALYTGTMAAIYFLPCFNEILQSFFRGLGRLKTCAFFSAFQVVIRVVLSALLIPHYGIKGICYAVGIGWLLMALFEGPFALYTYRHLEQSKG
ncbi:MAG: MATE family efflux transporter [Lachnospiraceae bacterium]|nr:MATE family efflux transporter [Lachnospiraceae bacterium]